MMSIVLFIFGVVIVVPQCILGKHIPFSGRSANLDTTKDFKSMLQNIHKIPDRVRRNSFEFDMGQGSRYAANHQLLNHYRAALIAEDPLGPGKKKRSRVNLPLLYQYFLTRDRRRFSNGDV